MLTKSDASRASRAHSVLSQSLVWDNHQCMPLRPKDESFLPQLQRCRDAGINIVSLNVGFDLVPWHTSVEMLATFRHWVRERPKEYLLVETAADIELARSTSRLGIVFDIEGGTALNGQLSMVELYRDLGVRWMLIAYNRNNELGGGCQDEDAGLTAFGREVLGEMSRVGMLACCSHTGYRTTLDVMDSATDPVLFSHSNPLGVWRHKRNVTDEVMKACARTGGVIGVNGLGIFLGRNDNSTAALIRHLRYVVDLVGAQHVGLGLDYAYDQEELDGYVRSNPMLFPPSEGYAAGIRMIEPERMPELVDEMLRLGYSDAAVEGILGGNLLRVAQRVWKVAAKR